MNIPRQLFGNFLLLTTQNIVFRLLFLSMDVKIFWSYRNTKGAAPSESIINLYKDKGLLFDEANKVIYANGLPYHCESHDNLPYQPKGDYLTEHQKIKTLNGESLVGDGNITIDLSLYKVVTSLPTTGEDNKIYLMLSESSEEGNLYTEYAYVEGEWEELGRYQAKVDLTDYITSDKLTETVNTLKSNIAETYVTKEEDKPYHDKVDATPNIKILTYDEYINLLEKDPDTLYFIKGDMDVTEMELGWEHLTRE